MTIALNENTHLHQDVLATSESRLCVENKPKYQDLGEVISGASGGAGYQVAASGICVSAEYTGLGWVHNYIEGVRSNQNFDVGIVRRTAGTDDYHAAASAQTAGEPNYKTTGVNTSFTNGRNLLGDKCKFYVKNVGASAANIWLQVQLMS